MKKFFIALSVLAALMLTVVPSQALIGMPDDTPGNSAVVPFICSEQTGLNTLIAFQDVGLAGGINFHYTIHTVRSVTVFDADFDGSVGDITATDAITQLGYMAPAVKESLKVTMGGVDYYMGYFYFNSDVTTNSVVGQFYLVNLANGIAASANIPMKEYDATLGAFQAQMAPGSVELFSANALQGAEDLQDGLVAPTDAAAFGLYHRFFILGQGDATWLIYWMSANDVLEDPMHLNFWDDAEHVVSSNLTIKNELTIIDVEPLLPLVLFPADTFKKEGWIQTVWPTGTAALRNLEILGWTYQQAASGIASANWTVLTPMWRDLP